MLLDDYLKAIADAIREKTGGGDEIPAMNFPDEIKSISATSKYTGEFINSAVASGTGAITFVKKLSTISDIRYLLVCATYTDSSTGEAANAWAAYSGGEVTTSDDTVTLVANGPAVYFKVNCSRSNDSKPPIVCLAVGDAA